MKFQIEKVIEHGDDTVEIRARLEDGRLACVNAPQGDDAAHSAAIEEYLAGAFPPEPAKGDEQ